LGANYPGEPKIISCDFIPILVMLESLQMGYAMTLLNPRVGVAFKKIFGSPENKDLLISFINAVVTEADQVVDVELLNPYNSQNFTGDKMSILDIKAKDTRGNYYNIEVQISNEGDYDKRALYYWAKLYADQLYSGDNYKKLRKAVAIHVLNFISVPNTPNYLNKFIITNEETRLRHFEDLEIYTIELSKFTDGTDDNINLLLPRIKNGLDRWVTFLTNAYCLDLNNLPRELDDPCIKKAFDVLTRTWLNKEERDLYEGHLKWLMIEASTLEKAKEEGKAEGRTEEKIRIAKELLHQGIEQELICKITKLSEEDFISECITTQ
jgi:predicted transposase/invertase (TIGR01784 family)